MSILEALGLEAFGVYLLIFTFILLISPWLAGHDFGIFKVPNFGTTPRRVLKILGPILFAAAVVLHLPILETESEREARLWEKVAESRNSCDANAITESIEQYQKRYPNGSHADDAQRFKAENLAFQEIAKAAAIPNRNFSSLSSAVRRFNRDYPSSFCLSKVEEMARPKVLDSGRSVIFSIAPIPIYEDPLDENAAYTLDKDSRLIQIGIVERTNLLKVKTDEDRVGYVESSLVIPASPHEAELWESILKRVEEGGWRDVQANVDKMTRLHPQGQFYEAGKGLMREIQSWQSITDFRENAPGARARLWLMLRNHLREFPEGLLHNRAEALRRKLPDFIKDCDKCPLMVRIPAGDHVPQIAIGDTEISVAEYRGVVNTRTQDDEARCFKFTNGKLERQIGTGWWNVRFNSDDSHPVVCVSLPEVNEFIARLNDLTGNKWRYRLPTQAEWEYAARGGSTRSRYWEEDGFEACHYENVQDRSAKEGAYGDNLVRGEYFDCDDGHAYTAPVLAEFEGNGYGLQGMLGNVSEWTCQQMSDNSLCDVGIIRGPSWRTSKWRTDLNFSDAPSPEARADNIGFRIVRPVSSSE